MNPIVHNMVIIRIRMIIINYYQNNKLQINKINLLWINKFYNNPIRILMHKECYNRISISSMINKFYNNPMRILMDKEYHNNITISVIKENELKLIFIRCILNLIF